MINYDCGDGFCGAEDCVRCHPESAPFEEEIDAPDADDPNEVYEPLTEKQERRI